jgi:hypothetical protein
MKLAPCALGCLKNSAVLLSMGKSNKTTLQPTKILQSGKFGFCFKFSELAL